MKKILFLCLLAMLMPILVGCGGGGDSWSYYEADIYSDQPIDADIAYNSTQRSYTITNGPNTLYFGIDDVDPNFPEYRAFLDFPLNGATGGAIVPVSARIDSATLELFINEVSFASVVPSFIDLISYPLSGVRVVDFDSLPLKTQTVNFYPSDQGAIVAIDITPLMREAQWLGLADLQLRFVLDLAVNAGFIGIDDRPNVSVTAPLLRVKYML
ncbi:MAG: hypothetical protein KJ950_05035 [Proteobacteria bacterium]|nr:hypothetical protein [Pseudomonadota bacterium]MBU1686978.1 hypothetical protein [Pseudomonadota bacterium]